MHPGLEVKGLSGTIPVLEAVSSSRWLMTAPKQTLRYVPYNLKVRRVWVFLGMLLRGISEHIIHNMEVHSHIL